jgi:hypothetical protein
MTPKRAFESGGFNPNNGLHVKQWYGVGCTFVPQRVRFEGEILFGFRLLACMDVASHYTMHHKPLPRPPDPLKAVDVIEFLSEAVQQYGPPHDGIVVSHSAWLSSTEMLLDEDTAPQGQFLQREEIEFGPMEHGDKQAIETWVQSLGVRCEFNADNISNAP